MPQMKINNKYWIYKKKLIYNWEISPRFLSINKTQ